MLLKKVVMIAVAFALLAVPVLWNAPSGEAAPPTQGDQPSQRTITVTGFGTAYGAPDVVRVGLGVESVNQDIMTAMDDVSTRIETVMRALQDAGVAPEDIRTEYFSIYQDYGYGTPAADGGQPTPAYRVSTSLAVTVRNTENVGELLASAVAAGANLVNYLQFDIEDRSALESEARADAVADARARADELAAQLGLTVGEPIRVVEGMEATPLFDGLRGGGGAGAASVPISQGQLSVSMQVTITYAVQ